MTVVGSWPPRRGPVLLLLAAGLLSACGPAGATPTDAPDEKTVNPVEYVARNAQCLRAGGARVTQNNPVELAIEPGPGMSGEALRALVADCKAQAGPPPQRRTDRETALRVYQKYLEVRDCLEAEGYQTIEPPSQETFVEQFASGSGEWHPYNGLETQYASQAEQERVEAKCPAWVQ